MWHAETLGPRRGRVVPFDGRDGRGLDSCLQIGYAIRRPRVCCSRCLRVYLREPRVAVGQSNLEVLCRGATELKFQVVD